MFLLNGVQARAKSGGENASNYSNPEYDALFARMRHMTNSPERQQIIDRMVDIFRRDAPWIGGFHRKTFGLYHSWLGNLKPNEMADNKLRYYRIDPRKREAARREWNRPILWPVLLILLAIVAATVPAFRSYRRRERMAARPAS
jgi:oligopeptide transport system substrate-binding protein